MLVCLIYISNRQPNCTDLEIENILKSCIKNNPEIEITGVLLYSDTMFMQYVEGDYAKIMPLYNKIKTDDRHDKVILLSLGMIKERIFPNWHMGKKQVSTQDINYLTTITKDEKAVFENILQGSEEQGKKVQNVLNNLFA